jgi:hypothetical protein
VNGARTLILNPVYTGEARYGLLVNPAAHEPIVTQAEFDAAQVTPTLLYQRDGSVASKALLGGLARCGGCGYTLKITGRRIGGPSGEKVPVYYCKGRSSKGRCPEQASIRAHYLDEYVEEQVLLALGDEHGLFAEAVEASNQIDEAQRELEAAEHELVLFLETDLVSTIGQSAFRQGVKARQAKIEESREKLIALRAQSVMADELPTGDLLEAWPELTIQERRQLLHGMLDRVVLTRSDGRNLATHKPIDERTTIVLRGGQKLRPPPVRI